MLDSLVSWQKGMTHHGMINMTDNIRAASVNLRLVLCDPEDWLNSLAVGAQAEIR